MTKLNITHNAFNGAVITDLPQHVSASDIEQLIKTQRALNKALLWATVPINRSELIPLFTEQGFVFHLCHETSITLICRLHEDAYAPFAPTHTVGVGGLVTNEQGEVLLIRDKWMNGKGFKLPGGYVDLGEPLHAAAEREVSEETGVRARFEGLLSVVSKHPHNFQKSNLYIICKLTPLTQTIAIQDTDEIEVAQWMAPDTFVNDADSSTFHRHLVKSLSQQPCLPKDAFEFAASVPAADKFMYSGQ